MNEQMKEWINQQVRNGYNEDRYMVGTKCISKLKVPNVFSKQHMQANFQLHGLVFD